MYTGPARKGWTSLNCNTTEGCVAVSVLWTTTGGCGPQECEIQPKAGFHTVFTPKLRFGVKVKSFHCKFTVRCKHLTLLHWLRQCSKFAMECTTTYGCGAMLHWLRQCSKPLFFLLSTTTKLWCYAALARPMQQNSSR